MSIIVKGKNTVVSEPLKEYVGKKLQKIARQFTSTGDVVVLLKVEQNDQIVEVSFPAGDILIRAEESSKDLYASIDLVVEKIERQIHKYKTRLAKRRTMNLDAFDLPEEPAAAEAEDSFEIIKNKHFKLKPMDAEEAILQMNMLNHDFFVFFSPETNGVQVVYRRKDGKYGIIVPEFD